MEYAKVYFLFIALIVVVTVLQLFATLTMFATPVSLAFVMSFLPAIIGGGGSLVFFVFKYWREGLFFNSDTDERIDEYKVNVKSKCYLLCLYVYIICGFLLSFFDFSSLELGVILMTWFIPTTIAVIRITLRGLYAPGSKAEATKTYRQLRKSMLISALLFGMIMALPALHGRSGEFDCVITAAFVLTRNVLTYAAFWGVVSYFFMVCIDKASEKFANKRLKAVDDESQVMPNEKH